MKKFRVHGRQLENESAAALAAGCAKRASQALEDGTIDIIVTDHAPHSEEEKAKGMHLAPFGIVGFETAFPLLYTKFVVTGRWTLGFLLEQDDAQSGRSVRTAVRDAGSRQRRRT